jgi:predicted dehydrogenase
MVETLTSPVRRSVSVALPKLGFAGVGWIGRNRLEAIATSGCAEVAAIADPVVESATEVALAFPAATVTGSFEELLAMDLDGIVIATPSALHAAQAVAALRSGKAVFCQKPLGRNAEETRQVIAAAREAGLLLGVDLSYRWTTGMQRIRQLIADGTLGRIYAVEMVFHNAYGPDKAWFYDRKQAGGGCLLDLGIHLIDLALWCLEFPPVVSTSGTLLAAGEPAAANGSVEDYAAGQLQLSNGVSVQLACSWRAPAGCDAHIELTFFGTRGGASFRNVRGSFYEFVAEHFSTDRSRRELASGPEPWGGRAAAAWAAQLARSRAYDPGIEPLQNVAATIDRLYGTTNA